MSEVAWYYWMVVTGLSGRWSETGLQRSQVEVGGQGLMVAAGRLEVQGQVFERGEERFGYGFGI